MAMIFGDEGLVTSWTGTFNNYLATYCKYLGFSFTVTTDIAEATPFASGGQTDEDNVGGLKRCEVVLEGFAAAPAFGNGGSIAFASGYTANPMEWSITLNAKHTFVPIQGQTWYKSVFGYVSGSGSFTCAADDATAISLGATGSATFSLVDGAGGKQLGGTIRIESVTLGVNNAGLNVVTYGFRFRQGVTTAGTSSSIFWAADGGTRTITKPVAGTLTVQSDSGQTYSGSAGWRTIEIKCKAAELITIRVTAAVDGAWS